MERKPRKLVKLVKAKKRMRRGVIRFFFSHLYYTDSYSRMKVGEANVSKQIKRNMDVEWSYEGQTGPEHWHELCDWFAKGAQYPYQSPISLSHGNHVIKNSEQAQLFFHYQTERFTEKEFKNTIHFVPYSHESYVVFQNVRYFLTDIHFHRPSEHIIDGQVHEIEFHLVHTSEQQKNLVVGVICTFDTEAVELDKVDIQSKWDFPNHLQTFSPAIFLPQNQSYFHYTGSLTTPPTAGPVQWFVFETIQHFNPEFLKEFSDELLEKNNRPIQETKGRSIYYVEKN